MDLGPDGEHHIAEHTRIQRDEGDVTAEVEGQHAADEEEEHAAGFFPFQVLSRQDRLSGQIYLSSGTQFASQA